MLTEQCVACGTDVPLGSAVHMLVNPKGDEGVVDGYLCRGCYEEHVEPILPPGDGADAGDDAPDADAPDADTTDADVTGEQREEGENTGDGDDPLGDDDTGSTEGDDPEPGEA